jgi:hypothetical protein
MITPPKLSDDKAMSLLCTQEGQLIRGVKIEWSSVHADGNPFTDAKPWRFDEKCLKAGVSTGKEGMKSTRK